MKKKRGRDKKKKQKRKKCKFEKLFQNKYIKK